MLIWASMPGEVQLDEGRIACHQPLIGGLCEGLQRQPGAEGAGLRVSSGEGHQGGPAQAEGEERVLALCGRRDLNVQLAAAECEQARDMQNHTLIEEISFLNNAIY